MAGAAGKGAVPPQYFGIVERFSVFAAVGFNAVCGIYLFRGFADRAGHDHGALRDKGGITE